MFVFGLNWKMRNLIWRWRWPGLSSIRAVMYRPAATVIIKTRSRIKTGIKIVIKATRGRVIKNPNWSPLSDPRSIIDCLCSTCRTAGKIRFSDSIERRESIGGREDEEAMWLTGFMVYSTSRRVHREAYNIVSSLRFGLTAWVSDDVPWCMTRCRVPIRRASMKAGSVPDVKYRRFGMKRSTQCFVLVCMR